MSSTKPDAPAAPAGVILPLDDQFAAMSSSQLRSAMQSRGIGRGAHDTPVDFRRKLRAYEAGAPPAGAPIRVRTAGGRVATILERRARGWLFVELDGDANDEGGAGERKSMRRPHAFAPGQDHLLDAAPQAAFVPKPKGSGSSTPRAAPRDRSGPAQPSAAALARSAAIRKGRATRNNPWTRVQDAKLLKAWREDKTDQALADAVGDGRTPEECQKRLHGMPRPLVPRRGRGAVRGETWRGDGVASASCGAGRVDDAALGCPEAGRAQFFKSVLSDAHWSRTRVVACRKLLGSPSGRLV